MRKSKYTKELLEPLVAQSFSLMNVLRALNLRPTGGNYRMLHARIRLLGINTDHFRGMGWSRGETAETNPIVARVSRKIAFTDEEAFTENSPVICGYKV